MAKQLGISTHQLSYVTHSGEGEVLLFWTAYQQDRDLLRFHYHRPREIWENLKDLDLPRRTFSSELWHGCAYYLFPAEWCNFAGYGIFD